MFEFDKKIMKKYVGSVMFQRGMNVYLRSEVKEIDFKSSESEYIISGTVQALESKEKNTVEILINKNTGEIKFNCNCYDFKDYIGKVKKIIPCKHIVAVSMRHTNGVPQEQYKIQKKREERNRKNDLLNRYPAITIPLDREIQSVDEEASIATNLLHQIEKFETRNEIEKTKLNLMINCGIENGSMARSFIELKIGDNYNYEINNIETFLKAVKYKNIAIKYSNDFLFNPKNYYFDSIHQNIIDLLIEIYETFIIANDNTSSKLISGKKIYLSDNYLKRLFKLLENENLSVSINSKNSSVKVLKEDLPLIFEITEKDSKVYIIHAHSLPVPITKDKEYFFFDENIYKPSSEQIDKYSCFYDAFLHFEGLPIKIDGIYMKEIINYTLPRIKSISKSVILSENIDICKFLEPLKLEACLILKDDLSKNEIEDTLNLSDNNNYKISIIIHSLENKKVVENMLKDSGFMEKNDKFILEDEEKLMLFLTNNMGQFENYGEVILSEKLSNLKIYKYSNFTLHINLNSNNLIGIYLTINGDIVRNFRNILSDIKQGKVCHRICEDEFIYFNDENFSTIQGFIDYLNDCNISTIPSELQLFKYKSVQIEQYLFKHKIDCVKINKELEEFISQMYMKHDVDSGILQSVNHIISNNYEIESFKWIKKMVMLQCGGLIIDTGNKMRQVIAFIASEIEEVQEQRKKTIIITTAILMDKWKSEFQTLASELNVIVLSGNRSEDKEFEKGFPEVDVVITTIDNTERGIYDFKDIFTYCFLEETCFQTGGVRYLKNLNSKIYFALTTKDISAENNLRELWAIFNLVLPIYLDSEHKFIRKYDCEKNEDLILELENSISPFISINPREGKDS